jgi:hypothetical protein
MFAGAAVAVLPYLGFPNSWDSAFFLILGIFVIALGIVVRRSGAFTHEISTHIVETQPREDAPSEIE